MRYEKHGYPAMRKPTFTLVAAIVASLTIAAPVLVAAPVATAATGSEAAAARQPDGRIRLQKIAYELFPTETYARPWIGDDLYNSTQTAKELWFDTTPGWQRWVFAVSVQNDGTSSDRIRVRATGTSLQGWSVKYSTARPTSPRRLLTARSPRRHLRLATTTYSKQRSRGPLTRSSWAISDEPLQ
jgi:hypothetical protein